jgi:RNA polymerase sigma-70 factor (TIGR02960 family)
MSPTQNTIVDSAALARHRRELHVHCYRMLGSFEEAEDVVQEALLNAWNARDSFGTEGNVRAWLYKIATNACLDALRRSARRPVALARSFSEIPWLQPYPDHLLDEIAPTEEQPDASVIARETIELAFLALIQVLPARQRAVLVMRDVLDFSAAETASMLDMSVPAVTSALQRARATMRERPASEHPVAKPSPYEEELLAKFIEAHERGDTAASLAIAREDIRITMPPQPLFFQGHDDMRELCGTAFGDGGPSNGMGQWRLVPTTANRMPAAASYLRRPGDTQFRAFKLDILRVEGRLIAAATTFDSTLFPAFGLPPTLDD